MKSTKLVSPRKAMAMGRKPRFGKTAKNPIAKGRKK